MRTMASRPGLDVHAPRPANPTRQCFSVSRCNSFNSSESTHVWQPAGLPSLEQGQAGLLPAWRPSGWAPAAMSAGLELKPRLADGTVPAALAAAPIVPPAASAAVEALAVRSPTSSTSQGSLAETPAAASIRGQSQACIRRPRRAAAGTSPHQPAALWELTSQGSEAKTTVAARLAAMPLPPAGVQLVPLTKPAPGFQLPLVKRGWCPGWP